MPKMMYISIGLVTDEEEIPVRKIEISPEDRMETIIFNNFNQYNIDFLVLCGDTEIWSAKESNGAHFDLSPYSDQNLMIYHRECEKYKVLKELRKAYKNATDKLAHFFIETPMPHINLKINGFQITALVDTGAQLSIITRSVAEKCGIFQKLDSRFQVDAQGIGGVSQALGKILDVELEFSGYFLPVVLTVFEECSMGCDLIIGVDILTAYGANVDFKNKCVRFNEELEVEMV
ncbi:unnamed protein product [Caenorhabditis nigoni]